MGDSSERPRYTIEQFTKRWREVQDESRRLVGLSVVERLALCDGRVSGFTRRLLSTMKPHDYVKLVYNFRFYARPKQILPSGPWLVFFNCGGRGVGKTWVGNHFVKDRMERGEARQIAFVGEDLNEIRKTMFGGRKKVSEGYNGSGILDILPPWAKVNYRPDQGEAEITLGKHTAFIMSVSAHQPEWRGAGTDTVVGEEMINWKKPGPLLDNILFTMRDKRGGVGTPRLVLGSTPKNMGFLRDLVMSDDTATRWHRQAENTSNLREGFIRDMHKRFAGTRRGLEEIEGELVGDTPGALFSLETIERYREHERPEFFDDGLISVDPAVSETKRSDATGICAAGRIGSKRQGEVWILEEHTDVMGPEKWADVTVELAIKWGFPILVERNRGGSLVAANVRAALFRKSTLEPKRKAELDRVKIRELTNDKYKGGKEDRAEPVSILYSRGVVKHYGRLPRLEDEMTTWVPGETAASPNGVDAVCNAVTNLLETNERLLEPNRAVTEAVEANRILDEAASGKLAPLLLGGSRVDSPFSSIGAGRHGRRPIL